MLDIEKLEDELEYTKKMLDKKGNVYVDIKTEYLNKDKEIKKLKQELGDL